MSPCLDFEAAAISGQALGLSSNTEFCVSRIWSRLHQGIGLGLRLRSTTKTLKRRLCLAGSVLIAATRQDKCGFIHSFIIYFHLFSVDSLQNDCLSDSKIWSDFNDEYAANTQSVMINYSASVPTEACVIKWEMRAPPTFQSDQRQGCDFHPNRSIDLSNAAICRTTCSVELVPR